LEFSLGLFSTLFDFHFKNQVRAGVAADYLGDRYQRRHPFDLVIQIGTPICAPAPFFSYQSLLRFRQVDPHAIFACSMFALKSAGRAEREPVQSPERLSRCQKKKPTQNQKSKQKQQQKKKQTKKTTTTTTQKKQRQVKKACQHSC